MRFVVCLHGASVAHASLPLHPTDRQAIRLAAATGAEIAVLEAVDQRGSAPTAVSQALDAGAVRAVRLVEPILREADAHSTGFALATVIDLLKVDLVLFGCDADPEGIPDVPASIAHHMTALFLPGVTALKTPASVTTPPAAIEAVVESAGWVRRLELPLNAVLGVDAGREVPPDFGSIPFAGSRPNTSVTPPPASLQVVTLQDLHLDPGLIRRRNDLRGVIEPAPRPLVTLKSPDAVAALLRSQGS